MNITKFLFLFIFIGLNSAGFAQRKEPIPDAEIKAMVTSYKKEAKGPYKDIRWFCQDGSTVSPQERCPEPGVQRARYKDEVIQLATRNHIFLGQILSKTDIESFWDVSNHGSQIKQYSLEQYLRANDNGWINRRAQYYRGAYQVEDEEAWGRSFLQWVLEDQQRIQTQYFLIRQSAKDIPHSGISNTAEKVRSLSKEIADLYTPFMDLRVKIHGQPESSDIQKVQSFQASNQKKLTPKIQNKFDSLLVEMQTLYRPISITDIRNMTKTVPAGSPTRLILDGLIQKYPKYRSGSERTQLLAETALALRTNLINPMKSSARLSIIDASIKLETMLIQEAANWQPSNLAGLMKKSKTLAQAATGFGYLELWEWETLESYRSKDEDSLSLASLGDQIDHLRRSVEWGSGTFRAHYQKEIRRFAAFEPLSQGFIDDRVRSSVLLPLGSSVSALGDFFAREAGFSNSLMGISNPSAARGLNAGYAMGELVVTNQSPEDIEVSSDKIYVFNRPPADLKPVAGIATVTEGNMVSHVQLLARNLGIPNAVISAENLTSLLPFNGTQVFYAISNKGTVLLKPASEMTPIEKALFNKKVRNEEKISVPVEVMELGDARILNLRDVNTSKSGIVCGPKAANLGQLKQLFPDHVVNGIVIPFAIFKQHFDQMIPGMKQSYWSFLKETFNSAEEMRSQGIAESEIETYVLGQLSILRQEIQKIAFLPTFEKALMDQFQAAFGASLGKVPVFIRSDTNMEDLKDFTGAGLNLTLFNVLDAQKILQGIKDVWASPYTERSYKWRQKYLLNPENVFPSILIIPSVDADYSGVLITKGVTTGKKEDLTVAFNRGVGGAVEGQASETWLLQDNSDNILLTPAREPDYTTIPVTGGTRSESTAFDKRLLSPGRLESLRIMANDLKSKLAGTGLQEPYDVELGFKNDAIWLFQVRPFVENKRAAASDYLRSITPVMDTEKMIPLETKL